jgi:hypothetical protein
MHVQSTDIFSKRGGLTAHSLASPATTIASIEAERVHLAS